MPDNRGLPRVNTNKRKAEPKRRAPRRNIHTNNVTQLLWATALVSSGPWMRKELGWLTTLAESGLAATMANPQDDQALKEARRENASNAKRLKRLLTALSRLSHVLE